MICQMLFMVQIVNNPWQNAWTLVVHCNPNNQDAAPATKARKE